MTDGRLTAAQAHALAQAVCGFRLRKRSEATLTRIFASIDAAAHDERFSLEHGFIPPDFHLVETVGAELQKLGFKVSIKDSAGDAVTCRPPQRVLVIEW